MAIVHQEELFAYTTIIGYAALGRDISWISETLISLKFYWTFLVDILLCQSSKNMIFVAWQ